MYICKKKSTREDPLTNCFHNTITTRISGNISNRSYSICKTGCSIGTVCVLLCIPLFQKNVSCTRLQLTHLSTPNLTNNAITFTFTSWFCQILVVSDQQAQNTTKISDSKTAHFPPRPARKFWVALRCTLHGPPEGLGSPDPSRRSPQNWESILELPGASQSQHPPTQVFAHFSHMPTFVYSHSRVTFRNSALRECRQEKKTIHVGIYIVYKKSLITTVVNNCTRLHPA